ncbi:hypothetical protein N798_09160 [Knoellia flava TL1]|uniref:DUF4192 domain-containing protein n=1 Tax=Knoellia flava TL1 TaxID=1385518 RepID=A0ABR4XFS0_9MICO|nr:hypothetical protein N798_09160 [Knoellia flava TL1]
MKVSTTDEMLALLPHQVGHRISRSLTVSVVSGGLLGPVARIDLPPECDVRPTARLLLESLLRVEPQAALVVGHESVAGESRSLRRAVHRGLRSAGVGIIDHVVVRDGRWWGWCCRPVDELDGLLLDHADGHPVPDDFEVPAVAELIARGSAPLASRDQVGALVEENPALSHGVGAALATLPEPGAVLLPGDPTGLDAADRGGDDSLDRVPDVWAQVLAPLGDRGDTFAVTDEDAARLVRSLADRAWRDALVAWMSPVMFPLDKVDDESTALLRRHVTTGAVTTSEHSEVVLRRLLAMTTRVPDAWPAEVAAICTVAGCVAWGVGNGSTAGDAVARALRVDPDYRLAAFLDRMVEHQMRPRHRWGEIAA